MKDLLKRILCILLCLTMVIPAVSVKAAEAGDDDDIIGNLASLDAGFECSVNKDALEGETVNMEAKKGRITYTRTHVLASTSLSYSTHHFIVSGKPLKETEYITGANEEGRYNTTASGTRYGYLALTGNDTNTDEIKRTVTAIYEFSALELNKIADELGVKPYEEDGNQFVKVYMSHVFELKPKVTDSKGKEIDWNSATEAQKRSALDKWKKSAGGYNDLEIGLGWYRTYGEFFAPMGDTTFWSGGKSVESMRKCVNIEIKIPYVSQEVNVEVFLRDVDTDEITAVKSADTVISMSEAYSFVWDEHPELAGYTMVNSTSDKAEFIRQTDVNTTQSKGSYAADMGNKGAKVCVKSATMDYASGNFIVRTNLVSKKTKSIQLYIPVKTFSSTPEPTPDADKPAEVKIVYFDPATKKPVETDPAPDAIFGQTGYSAALDAGSIPGGYKVDTVNAGMGYAAYGKTDNVYATYGKGTKYSNVSISATVFTIKDTIVKASSTTKIALWVPVTKNTVTPLPTPVENPAQVKIVYFDPTTEKPVDTEAAPDAVIGQKGYAAALNASAIPEDYEIDTANTGIGYAAYGKTDTVYTTYNKGTKYSNISITATAFTINDTIVKASSTTKIALWVPVKKQPKVTVPVAVTIVYYNPTTKAVVGTDSAGEGQEGQKNFSAILDVKGKCGENYSVDTASTAYAAYGSTNNVITTYDKGTKYASVNCTTTKFTIKSELKKADFTAMWVPVKSGVPVTVKYVDRSGNVINIDDGGVTEKNKEYHYTVDPSIPGSSYTVKPDESYLKNGGNKKPLSSSGNDVSINKFPYDTATELYVPCDTKAVPTPIPSTYSWDYMDTQANAAGRCIITSDDFDVEVAIPSSENEYGQVTAAKYLTRGGISSHIGTRSYTVTVKQKAYRYWYDYDTTPVYETDPVTGAVVTDAYGNPVQAKDAYGFPKWDRGPDYQVSDSGYRTATITVELPWKWYSLDEYVLYKFVSATLTNGSADMPFEITPSLGDTISASYSVSGAESDHVKDPAGWTGTGMTITLSGSISSSSTGYSAPDWPNINLAAAESTVRTTLGEMQVKNDSLTLNGNVILNGSSWKTYSNLPEPDMSKVKASSTTTAKSPKQRIPDERSNMEYVSGGQLEYAMVGSYGSTMSDRYWSPVNVNSVKVHTPVTVKATFRIKSGNPRFFKCRDESV